MENGGTDIARGLDALLVHGEISVGRMFNRFVWGWCGLALDAASQAQCHGGFAAQAVGLLVDGLDAAHADVAAIANAVAPTVGHGCDRSVIPRHRLRPIR